MWQLSHQPLKKPSFWLYFSPTENESNYREGSCPQVLHCYPCLRNAAVVFLKSLLPILTKQTRKSMYGFCPIDGASFTEQNPTHRAGPVGCPRRINVTAQNPWRCLPSWWPWKLDNFFLFHVLAPCDPPERWVSPRGLLPGAEQEVCTPLGSRSSHELLLGGMWKKLGPKTGVARHMGASMEYKYGMPWYGM